MKPIEDQFIKHPPQPYRDGFKVLQLPQDAALHASVMGAVFDHAFREEGKILTHPNQLTPPMLKLSQEILASIPHREAKVTLDFEERGIEPRLVQALARLQTHAELFNPHTAEAYREHLTKIGFMLYRKTVDCHAHCLSQMPEKGLSIEERRDLARREANHIMTHTVAKALERHDPHSEVKLEMLEDCYREASHAHSWSTRQEIHRQLKPPAQDRGAKQALTLEF